MAYVATVPYADETFGTAYFADRATPYAEWTAASSPQRSAALKESTRWIDTIRFIGYKSTDDQAREFPREGDVDVPTEVQCACCELALAILQGKGPDAIANASNVQSQSTGDASVSYAGSAGMGSAGSVQAECFGLPSITAARLLAPWVDPDKQFDLIRAG